MATAVACGAYGGCLGPESAAGGPRATMTTPPPISGHMPAALARPGRYQRALWSPVTHKSRFVPCRKKWGQGEEWCACRGECGGRGLEAALSGWAAHVQAATGSCAEPAVRSTGAGHCAAPASVLRARASRCQPRLRSRRAVRRAMAAGAAQRGNGAASLPRHSDGIRKDGCPSGTADSSTARHKLASGRGMPSAGPGRPGGWAGRTYFHFYRCKDRRASR